MSIFMKLSTISGNSTVEKHEGEFELLSFGFGATSSYTNSGNGSGVGKTTFSPITVTLLNYNAPAFLKSIASGNHIATATFAFNMVTAGSPVAFQTITLSDAVLVSFQESSGGDRPVIELQFVYSKIKVEEPNLPSFQYDLKAAKGG